jgi:nicotinate-nucleotide adenylyltransferase
MIQSNSGCLRVAFFGGSFDPPHLGHLAVARAAHRALSLDMVLFAPVGAQPLKPAGSTASYADRVEMTRIAIEDEAAFKLSRADAPKSGGRPNYSLETLRVVKNQLPANSKLFCLMGADSFAGLRQWFRAEEIPFVAPLIVASRPGQPLDDLKAMLPLGLSLGPAQDADPTRLTDKPSAIRVQRYLLRNQDGQQTSFYLLPDLDVPISATSIRELFRSQAVAETHPAGAKLVPNAVAEYIHSHGLYH